MYVRMVSMHFLKRDLRHDDLMITLSKILEAQEKIQDIKQSPSMKIGTKPYARSRRNELADATGRKDRTLEARPDAGPVAWQTGDRTRGPDAGGETDRMQGSSVRSSTVRFQSGKSMTGRVRWQATGR